MNENWKILALASATILCLVGCQPDSSIDRLNDSKTSSSLIADADDIVICSEDVLFAYDALTTCKPGDWIEVKEVLLGRAQLALSKCDLNKPFVPSGKDNFYCVYSGKKSDSLDGKRQ